MRIEDFLERVTTETDADRLWLVATEWLSSQGFDKVLHLSIANGAVAARTTLGGAFEQYYRDEGMHGNDPFPKYCLNAPGPVATGVDYLGDYDYLVPEERRVITTAADAGFRAGFSLVVRRDALGCEAWNLGSSLKRSEIDKIRQERSLGFGDLRPQKHAAEMDRAAGAFHPGRVTAAANVLRSAIRSRAPLPSVA